jgi:hypothetical protein
VIYARCYGGSSITVGIDDDSRGQRVVIPCDDVEHVVTGPGFLPTGTRIEVDGQTGHQLSHAVLVDAGQLTAYRYGVVAR